MRLWQRDVQVLWRRSGQRMVLLTPEGREPIVLEGVGAAVWQLLAEPASTAELVEVLAEHFDVPSTMVEQDLPDFLEALRDHGAIHLGDPLPTEAGPP